MRRVKHFAGYGCVEMGVVEKHQIYDTDGVKKTKMAVLVKGNHERGLVPNCARYGYYSDVIHWVFNRFEKKFNGEEDENGLFIQTPNDDYYHCVSITEREIN